MPSTTSPTTVSTSNAGRPRGDVRTGPGYRFAEWLDKNWERKVGLTNDQVATKLGYRSPNIISMWRMGKTKIALDRAIEIADLMKVDMATILPLWFEQQLGEPGNPRSNAEKKLKKVTDLLARTMTANQEALIRGVRKALGDTDPDFEAEQSDATLLIAAHPEFAQEVLDLAVSKGYSVKALYEAREAREAKLLADLEARRNKRA